MNLIFQLYRGIKTKLQVLLEFGSVFTTFLILGLSQVT